MQFIQGNNRHQTYFGTMDDQVNSDNAVRLMDAFIDKLDLQQGTTQKIFIEKRATPCRILIEIHNES